MDEIEMLSVEGSVLFDSIHCRLLHHLYLPDEKNVSPTVTSS